MNPPTPVSRDLLILPSLSLALVQQPWGTSLCLYLYPPSPVPPFLFALGWMELSFSQPKGLHQVLIKGVPRATAIWHWLLQTHLSTVTVQDKKRRNPFVVEHLLGPWHLLLNWSALVWLVLNFHIYSTRRWCVQANHGDSTLASDGSGMVMGPNSVQWEQGRLFGWFLGHVFF